MMWLPIAGAALGALNAKQQRDDTERYNQAQAEIQKWSPWTGMQGNLRQQGPGMIGGALSGGLMGLTAAQGLAQMNAAQPAAMPMGPAQPTAGAMINGRNPYQMMIA